MQTHQEQELLVTTLPPGSVVEPQEQQTQEEECTPLSQGKSKRIVSKGEYAALIGRKAAYSLSSLALAEFTALCLVLCVGFLVGGFALRGDAVLLLKCLCASLLFGLMAIGSKRLAEKKMKQARQKLNVQPLTRANTADLPASDSLVRACQEPAQAQEGVLLRASSGEAQAGQEGQLLRESVGGQE